MKWPWVSRALYDAECAEHRRDDDAWAAAAANDCRRWLDMIHQWKDAHDALLEKYHALASPPATLSVGNAAPIVLEPKEPSAVTKTIREQAGNDAALGAHLRRYARELKGQGMSPDEIVGKLVAWQTSEPLDASA